MAASHLHKFDFLGELGRGAFGVVYKVLPHLEALTIGEIQSPVPGRDNIRLKTRQFPQGNPRPA